jgi:SAM-dependent methyltransferase
MPIFKSPVHKPETTDVLRIAGVERLSARLSEGINPNLAGRPRRKRIWRSQIGGNKPFSADSMRRVRGTTFYPPSGAESMSRDADYVLGTGDQEIARLGLQHRVWRPRALDVWRRAGFTLGQSLLDVGCGPGYASLDLAEIVGPSGQVLAMDRSRRFLDVLDDAKRSRGLTHLVMREMDLECADLPVLGADGAWCRWVFAFLREPRRLIGQIARSLRPGGTLVLHEYFDYSTWRMAPRSPEVEEFVRVVMESWRAEGGEPDIGLDLPRWLVQSGFEIRELSPIIDIVPATNFVWHWPSTFVESGLRRLVELDRLTITRAETIANAFGACQADPHTLMITPAVLEVIAVAGSSEVSEIG